MTDQFVCKRCCMDSTAKEIEFTETGCTFCDLAMKMKPQIDKRAKAEMIHNLRSDHPKYDVLLGLSGGADSSYCLHLLKSLGLRVLTFTVDNGYNNPLADENILKLVEGMKVPFFRYNIDLKKFQQVQAAFMKAGVKNLEIPTDHILYAASYEVAATYGIKTIISGGNWATESIMPPSWGYNARDLVHIKDICRKNGVRSLKGIPTCGLWKFNYYRWIQEIEVVNFLDYFNYNRADAVKELGDKYGFVDYHEKHCENYFTWWFQNYYLFEKFGIDKRKAHLSSLIVSGQMTRDEAMQELTKNPVYPRLGIEQKVMMYEKHEHDEFKKDEWLFNLIGKFVKKYVIAQ